MRSPFGSKPRHPRQLREGAREKCADLARDGRRPDARKDQIDHEIAEQNAEDPSLCGIKTDTRTEALQHRQQEGECNLYTGVGDALGAGRDPGADEAAEKHEDHQRADPVDPGNDPEDRRDPERRPDQAPGDAQGELMHGLAGRGERGDIAGDHRRMDPLPVDRRIDEEANHRRRRGLECKAGVGGIGQRVRGDEGRLGCRHDLGFRCSGEHAQCVPGRPLGRAGVCRRIRWHRRGLALAKRGVGRTDLVRERDATARGEIHGKRRYREHQCKARSDICRDLPGGRERNKAQHPRNQRLRVEGCVTFAQQLTQPRRFAGLQGLRGDGQPGSERVAQQRHGRKAEDEIEADHQDHRQRGHRPGLAQGEGRGVAERRLDDQGQHEGDDQRRHAALLAQLRRRAEVEEHTGGDDDRRHDVQRRAAGQVHDPDEEGDKSRQQHQEADAGTDVHHGVGLHQKDDQVAADRRLGDFEHHGGAGHQRAQQCNPPGHLGPAGKRPQVFKRLAPSRRRRLDSVTPLR